MSLHKSLKGSSKIQLKRNVLKRYERVDQLKKEGRLDEGESVLGLPKTKTDS
ncbi:MAG: small basic protein [Lentisphaeraceae bacterium]|nr:small basic protein [Lentisphaeraceae bacterium]